MADIPCSECVRPEYEREVERFTELFTRMRSDDDDDREAAYQEFHETGLCFYYVEGEDGESGYFRYQLSWGGPSDEFRFYTDPGFKLYITEYWFMDWFDGAKVDVDDDFAKELWGMFEDSAPDVYQKAVDD